MATFMVHDNRACAFDRRTTSVPFDVDIASHYPAQSFRDRTKILFLDIPVHGFGVRIDPLIQSVYPETSLYELISLFSHTNLFCVYPLLPTTFDAPRCTALQNKLDVQGAQVDVRWMDDFGRWVLSPRLHENRHLIDDSFNPDKPLTWYNSHRLFEGATSVLSVSLREADGDVMTFIFSEHARKSIKKYFLEDTGGVSNGPSMLSAIRSVSERNTMFNPRQWAERTGFSLASIDVDGSRIDFSRRDTGLLSYFSDLHIFAIIENDVIPECLFDVARDYTPPESEDVQPLILSATNERNWFRKAATHTFFKNVNAISSGGHISRPKTEQENVSPSRAIDISDDAPGAFSVPAAMMEYLSPSKQTHLDKQVGALMVIGLTEKSLSPIPFQMEKNLCIEESAIHNEMFFNITSRSELGQARSWLSNKSRVYVHRGNDGWRFIFAVKCWIRTDFQFHEKKSYLRVFGTYVKPSQYELVKPRPIRGAGPDLNDVICRVPGLYQALTTALNDAVSEVGKIENRNNDWSLLRDQSLPRGQVPCSPGWGADVIAEQIGTVVGQPRGTTRRARNMLGSDDSTFFSDGPYGIHAATGTMSSYRRMMRAYAAVPTNRVIDMVRDSVQNVGVNALYPAVRHRSYASGEILHRGARFIDDFDTPVEDTACTIRSSRQISLD